MKNLKKPSQNTSSDGFFIGSISKFEIIICPFPVNNHSGLKSGQLSNILVKIPSPKSALRDNCFPK